MVVAFGARDSRRLPLGLAQSPAAEEARPVVFRVWVCLEDLLFRLTSTTTPAF